MIEEIKQEEVKTSKKQKLVALKDFKFQHNKDVYEFKKGDEVDVPKMFLQNLKTEKVIK